MHDMFIGLFQKRTTPHPQRKFLLSREENRMKNVLNLYRMSIRRGGGLLVSSMGGIDIFLNNPFCGNIRKNYCQGINYIPCIFNILIVAIKI